MPLRTLFKESDMSTIYDEAKAVILDKARVAQRKFLVQAILRRDTAKEDLTKLNRNVETVSAMTEEQFKNSNYCNSNLL